MGINLACIGGRAAYQLVQQQAFTGERLGPQRTPFGESQPIYRCRAKVGEFYLLCRHGEAGYEVAPNLINYRANIYALKDLGVEAIVSWSETRAISHNFTIGEYVVVDDLIDETVSRPRTFFENRELGHIRHWPVFCPTLRGALNLALSEHACAHTDRGIYVCIEGPRQETPAEARKYQSYGGELIGQTLAPEVFLAKELQMNYACLGFVVRYAETGAPYPAFESGRVLSEAVLAERSRAAVERIPAIIHRVDELLVENAERNQDLLKNFAPPNGQRNGNWRAWFKQATAPRGGTEV